jgi:hypothetical protein
MKLAAIYNVWDGVELLNGSMKCLRDHVDLFIIVWQEVSNFGEHFNPLPEIDVSMYNNVVFHKYQPEFGSGFSNERRKRNIGLEIAKAHSCSHFMHIDVDEYYEDFGNAKELYVSLKKRGSVCKLYTYFKSPTLRFDTPDNYYVPFIHSLYANTGAGWSTDPYPFYVDPTRKINETEVIELPGVFMHHFSYVRKDIGRKVRNSSAKNNIEKSTLVSDYHSSLSSGSFVNGYGKMLIEVQNQFKIQI